MKRKIRRQDKDKITKKINIAGMQKEKSKSEMSASEEQKINNYIAKKLLELEQEEKVVAIKAEGKNRNKKIERYDEPVFAKNEKNSIKTWDELPQVDKKVEEKIVPGIKVATDEDQRKQYAKDMFNKALLEKREVMRMKNKEWIPVPNDSFIKRNLRIGKDYQFITNEKAQCPLLLLMRLDGDLEVFEDVKEGLFKIKITDNNGKEEVKGILLTEKKLHKMPYGNGEFITMWIAHENEATPYPHEVQHDSGMLVSFIEKIILNFSALDEGGPKGIWGWITKALPWIAGAAIVIYILWYFNIIPHGIIETVTPINATGTTEGNAIVGVPGPTT